MSGELKDFLLGFAFISRRYSQSQRAEWKKRPDYTCTRSSHHYSSLLFVQCLCFCYLHFVLFCPFLIFIFFPISYFSLHFLLITTISPFHFLFFPIYSQLYSPVYLVYIKLEIVMKHFLFYFLLKLSLADLSNLQLRIFWVL